MYKHSEKGLAVARKSVKKYLQTKRGKLTHQISVENHRCLKKMNGVGVDTTQWENIIRRYNYRCAYCGKRCILTQDHVVPVSKGGEHSPYNIVPACIECNIKKGVKLWQPRIFRKAK